MLKSIFSPSIFLILATGPGVCHGQTNLIVNPDFEQSGAGETPAGWQGVPDRIPDLFTTVQDELTGGKAGFVQNREAAWNRILQRPRIEAGKIYTFSARFRSVEDNTTIIVSLHDPARQLPVEQGTRTLNVDDGWQTLSFDFVSGDSGRHELRIRNSGTADFYIRDVSLKEAGKEIHAAGLRLIVPEAAPIPGKLDLKAEVLNQFGNSAGLGRETVRWELDQTAPDALNLHRESGRLVIGDDLPSGTEVHVTAVVDLDLSVRETAKIQFLTQSAFRRPRQVILTWQNDPQSTQTVSWRTDLEVENPKVYFTPGDGSVNRTVFSASGVSVKFDRQAPDPPVENTVWINTVELTGLTTGTLYRLRIPHETSPKDVLFKTAPEHPEEIVFTVFSDTHRLRMEASDREYVRGALSRVAEINPEFTLAVGDLWYADMQNHTDTPVDLFVDFFFDQYESAMTAPDGRLIPIVPAEGNHDGRNDGAPFFYSRFHLPAPHKYYVFQYGPDLTIITLNSGHSAGIRGEQTEWLERVLKDHRDSRWIIVQHHVSPYPAHRPLDGGWERQMRQSWVPLYEKYGVDLVINGHDHVYKRSHPIRNNRIDHEKGVIYIGDGLGSTRAPDMDRWFVKDAAAVDSFWKVTVSTDQATGESTLTAVPVFPFNPEHEGSPVYLKKNADGVRVR